MVVFALPALVPAIAGALGYVNSMPNWIKYLIFLGLLGADAIVEQSVGIGLTGTIMETGLAVIGFPILVETWQVLIIASFAPVVFWAMSN